MMDLTTLVLVIRESRSRLIHSFRKKKLIKNLPYTCTAGIYIYIYIYIYKTHTHTHTHTQGSVSAPGIYN